ncbi:unnamed protein product [Effrenium voratum]|uniref:WRC domain-containing protein n=1 Tax=Effrenium voratum TaxID=2562239 RepID=A0AA36JPR6_9DINO|nr:unnamed protein product [Effrenium voratum]
MLRIAGLPLPRGEARPGRGEESRGALALRAARGARAVQRGENCARPSSAIASVDDHLGLAGPRCDRHGARGCQVPNCQRPARRTIRNERGAKERRCGVHSERPRCNVGSCGKAALNQVFVDDDHGCEGPRCAEHGGGCQVPGCRRQHWARTRNSDEHGGPGWRCWKHKGHVCAVPGCGKRPDQRLKEADQYGPPGIRCKRHCPKKSGPPRPAASLAPEDEGPRPGQARCSRNDGKGWRCRRSVEGPGAFCEYHSREFVRKHRLKRRVERAGRAEGLELLQSCEEEGLTVQGFRAQACYHAFQCLLRARQVDEALPWLRQARQQLQLSRGPEDPDVRTLRGYEEDPLSHPAASDEGDQFSALALPAGLAAAAAALYLLKGQ